ncbi:hypothetical protein HYH03_002170 [Edaphochlamys debaryana]|uniref:Uncharacterized protein n=1 Tax=Edaphochlamys debaryana TaxID=47281 RepID=A0A835YFD4_9CHLO|nr:hypothetical protein HYH03_002170 [Edaphochlamys debaryana]|eukprot:KAG2499881.1 hypothetical protein HYH03_002170 [Edaphochlamys debaryana]
MKFASPSRALVLGILLAALLVATEAVHDRKRGLKTYGLSDEEIKEVMKDHDPHHILHKHKHKDDLKEHPEVKRFLEWREKHKAGHEDAGVAFAGKIPHDFIPHLIEESDKERVRAHANAHAKAHAHSHAEAHASAGGYRYEEL